MYKGGAPESRGGGRKRRGPVEERAQSPRGGRHRWWRPQEQRSGARAAGARRIAAPGSGWVGGVVLGARLDPGDWKGTVQICPGLPRVVGSTFGLPPSEAFYSNVQHSGYCFWLAGVYPPARQKCILPRLRKFEKNRYVHCHIQMLLSYF